MLIIHKEVTLTYLKYFKERTVVVPMKISEDKLIFIYLFVYCDNILNLLLYVIAHISDHAYTGL